MKSYGFILATRTKSVTQYASHFETQRSTIPPFFKFLERILTFLIKPKKLYFKHKDVKFLEFTNNLEK